MPLVCNLNAIDAAARPRYKDLVKQLHGSMRENRCEELPDGYAFRLDSKGITLPEVAEWISMERLCCPFLTLELAASGNRDEWVLKLTGPAGVKAILEAAFPIR
jgi:hypothetical protein